MNALERFCAELDELCADMAFAGLKNMQPSCLDKIARLAATAKELGLETGERLLRQFAVAVRNWRLLPELPIASDQEPEVNSANSVLPVALLCALDFYVKTILGNMETGQFQHEEEEYDDTEE